MRGDGKRDSLWQEVGSADKNRHVHIRSLVSLKLPGNLKVWLESHRRQVIIFVKQSVSYFNYREVKRERAIYHETTINDCTHSHIRWETETASKARQLVKTDRRLLSGHGCFGQCVFSLNWSYIRGAVATVALVVWPFCWSVGGLSQNPGVKKMAHDPERVKTHLD